MYKEKNRKKEEHAKFSGAFKTGHVARHRLLKCKISPYDDGWKLHHHIPKGLFTWRYLTDIKIYHTQHIRQWYITDFADTWICSQNSYNKNIHNFLNFNFWPVHWLKTCISRLYLTFEFFIPRNSKQHNIFRF